MTCHDLAAGSAEQYPTGTLRSHGRRANRAVGFWVTARCSIFLRSWRRTTITYRSRNDAEGNDEHIGGGNPVHLIA